MGSISLIVNDGGGEEGPLPEIRGEPPLQLAGTFNTVADCTSAIALLDLGYFMVAAWLVEQMMCNSRVRGVNQTRFDGLVGTAIRWEPGRKNEMGRRAARDIVDDFPMMLTAATRKQIARWSVNLGVAFAQKNWFESPSSGRKIPRVEHYHPQWGTWDWSLRAYRVWTLDGWSIVPSPSLSVPGRPWVPPSSSTDKPDTLRRWIVAEPFGQHSWRDGLVHAGWDPWLGLSKANRNLHRSSEKMGLGIVKVKYPKTTDRDALIRLVGKLRNLGREGVIPVEQYKADSEQASYDVEPFEFSQTGADIIRSDREACAADVAVLWLGHNTTAETKGASVGASAQVGNLIRGDIRVGDCFNELAWVYMQVLRPWAEENYGDAGLAPVPIYVTDPPSENQAAATTLFNVANAVEKLRVACPGIDFTELLSRFRIPMGPEGAGSAAPAVVSPSPQKPAELPESKQEPEENEDNSP